MIEDYRNEMSETIKTLCQPYKGILAADESTDTIGKRFAQVDVENTQDPRQRYRELLFNTPNIGEYISGVITYEETFFDYDRFGCRLIDPLLHQGIVVGIKTDKGLVNMPNSTEKMTRGLDDLRERCQKYYNGGARFAKWRSVYSIDMNKGQSQLAIELNASILAQYAAISQENGLVPIVETDVLMDGPHDICACYQTTKKVLAEVYHQLSKYGVDLSLTLLKPNMVIYGTTSYNKCGTQTVVDLTLQALMETVPVAVPGIVFLSGGLSETGATEYLKLINQRLDQQVWRLSFCYGRALQQGVLRYWKGSDENIRGAQEILYNISRDNGCASMGRNFETV